MSFKAGEEEYGVSGRLFVDHTVGTLGSALVGIAIELVESWVSSDLRPGRVGERWLNVIARRR